MDQLPRVLILNWIRRLDSWSTRLDAAADDQSRPETVKILDALERANELRNALATLYQAIPTTQGGAR